MVAWPAWWSWELEFSTHTLKRMIDRAFAETDLRAMLEDATGYRADYEPGRWVIETGLHGAPWEVVVEPIEPERILLVITAYPVD